MPSDSSNSNQKIADIQPTDECLTSRAGLAPYNRYLDTSGLLDELEQRFDFLRKIARGLSVREGHKQIMNFFVDGTHKHLTGFDELQNDDGYAGTLENTLDEMASSHQIKRLCRAFPFFSYTLFRPLLRKMFLTRLNQEQPNVIFLFMDTMVMDNDQAEKREAVDPTYKGVKGFQPFQIFWKGLPVDAVFRGGSKHSNHGDTARKALDHLIDGIRSQYDETVPIIVGFDGGFFDQTIMNALDDQPHVGYIGAGKRYSDLCEYVQALPEDAFESFVEKDSAWTWTEFGDCRGSWETFRRVIYSRPDSIDGQYTLDLHPASSVWYTNIGMGMDVDDALKKADKGYYVEPENLLRMAHQRGDDELKSHRYLKDFGWEQLPFKRFVHNMAMYYIMLVAFFSFRAYQWDVGQDIIDEQAYPSTIRRQFIDVAGKLVHHAGQVVLKVSRHAYESLQFETLWKRCNSPPALV